jgi:hypothetical protein
MTFTEQQADIQRRQENGESVSFVESIVAMLPPIGYGHQAAAETTAEQREAYRKHITALTTQYRIAVLENQTLRTPWAHSSGTICIRPVTCPASYASALHEIGHIVNPCTTLGSGDR